MEIEEEEVRKRGGYFRNKGNTLILHIKEENLLFKEKPHYSKCY